MRFKTLRDVPCAMVVTPSGVPVLLLKSDPEYWTNCVGQGYIFSMIVDVQDMFRLQFLVLEKPGSVEDAICLAETGIINHAWRPAVAVLLECRRPMDLFVGTNPEDLIWYACCHDGGNPATSKVLGDSYWYENFSERLRNILSNTNPSPKLFSSFDKEFLEANAPPDPGS